VLEHSIVSQHFKESESSISNSQELSTSSYPEPDQSSQHHTIPPLQYPYYVLVFLAASFSHQQPICVPLLPHSCYVPRPSHPPQLHYCNYTWRRVQIMKLFIMQFFFYPPVTSFLLGPNILLNTLFSNTLSLCSTLNVREQVSHPYKTTGKIIVLYILIF
jgi:hypothetical protein